ncbi:MAG: cell division protein FtsZ, partial [Clostridia bacterium]|nr:cell division protein FtsZ [Clostridia bacterium]
MFNDSATNTPISGKARIKVIGVGGAGNNAINRMIEARISCAEYVVVNTDSQILALSPCENKIQIGTQLTKGLGAGANPDVGRQAAEESKDILTEVIKGTDLLFITAGMGGGTGTGAAPVIAKIARDMKILTVAVVTEPFAFEGKKRMDNTIMGLDNLKKYVDTLIVIPNDKIRTVVDKNTTMVEALRVADEILKQGIKGLAELIVNPALINLDFADVKTILKDRGIAHLGVGVARGDNRIIEAVRLAVNCPLLETTIEGAQGVILNVVGGNDLTFAEVADAAELVRSVVDASANIIFGARIDPNVKDEVEITVIATGFPGYENTQREEQQRAYTNGQLYNQQPYSQGRMSVNEPYYPQQRYVPQQPSQPAQSPA